MCITKRAPHQRVTDGSAVSPAGAGHVFCVSRCSDRDCCGNGGGARVENDHFLPNHHGGFAQNGHFRSSTAVEIGKILIFCRLPRWKPKIRPYSAKNRGARLRNGHFAAVHRGARLRNDHFSTVHRGATLQNDHFLGSHLGATLENVRIPGEFFSFSRRMRDGHTNWMPSHCGCWSRRRRCLRSVTLSLSHNWRSQ